MRFTWPHPSLYNSPMPTKLRLPKPLVALQALLKSCLLGAAVGGLSGVASAIFLHALAWATGFREGHPALLFGLPVAGAVVGWVYQRFGASVAGGSNLLLERIHEPGPPVPFRMAPLILLATVITHLFGGSAGREGTAVQQGGSLGSALAQVLRLSEGDRQLAIQCGISGGFGSVFGTPLAGAVFGRRSYASGGLAMRAWYHALWRRWWVIWSAAHWASTTIPILPE